MLATEKIIPSSEMTVSSHSSKNGCHYQCRNFIGKYQHVCRNFCTAFPLLPPHGKPGEAYTRLITASCEAGPGTTHMCTFEICVWSLQILEIADRCVFHNSIFGSSKCHLYIDFMKKLKSSCQESSHQPFNGL